MSRWTPLDEHVVIKDGRYRLPAWFRIGVPCLIALQVIGTIAMFLSWWLT